MNRVQSECAGYNWRMHRQHVRLALIGAIHKRRHSKNVPFNPSPSCHFLSLLLTPSLSVTFSSSKIPTTTHNSYVIQVKNKNLKLFYLKRLRIGALFLT